MGKAMAYDEGLAQLLRDDLAEEPITEKKMFGGLAFLLHGNMVCGTHKNGAMYRVGKPNNDATLAMPGVAPMMFTGKAMAGFVETTPERSAEDPLRQHLVALALGFVKTLPAK